MKTTVVLHDRIFDLGHPDRVVKAEEWIAQNLGDTSKFRHEFPDAQPLNQELGSGDDRIRFLVKSEPAHCDDAWVAQVRVVFARADGSTGHDLKDAGFMGTFHFAEDADEAGKRVKVKSIDKNGTVHIGPPDE